MKGRSGNKKPHRAVSAAVAISAIAIAALFWGEGVSFIMNTARRVPTLQEQGEIFGVMPKPVQPKFVDPVMEPFSNNTTRKVVIKRIPRISKSMKMPHPFWGECSKCHLFKGGPPTGSQWKSPVGQALETISMIMKVGPPIRPNSTRPHPPAGRCIKCHDIVIETPI